MSRQKSWYRIEAKSGGVGEIVIYDEIGAWGITAKDFLTELKALGDVAELVVRINSPGGSVFDGNAIYNALRRHTSPVTVWVDGLAASIASVIAMAGDRVIMPENAMMMIHDPSGLVWGTAEDMEKMADALAKMKAGLVAAYRGKSGLPDAEIEKMMSDETWLTAAEAEEKGFADEIDAPVEMAASFDLSKFQRPPENLFAGLSGQPAAASGGIPITQTQGESGMSEKTKTAPAAVATQPDKTLDPPVTAESITASHPDIAQALRADGAKAERERILGIEDLALAGHDDLVARLKADGKTSAPEAAVMLIAAEKETGARKLAALKGDEEATPKVEPVAIATAKVSEDAPVEDRCKAKWDASSELRAEFNGSFDRYLAYSHAVEGGKVKLLSKTS